MEGQLSEESIRAWLIVDQALDIASYERVVTAFGDIHCALQQNYSTLKAAGLSPKQAQALTQPNEQWLQQSLEWLYRDSSHFLLTLDSPEYPPLLASIHCPPLCLFGKGNMNCLQQPQLAMVGSRNASISGKENARKLAFQLSQHGWTITSGMALGIDGASHLGALDNNGKTIAVMGAGLNHIYPKRHRKLADSIVEYNGCLLSEFAPAIQPLAENFPRRNRIVSGLSLGVLVVEAAIKSGSLISAYYALEQGREVFAIPGNINNPVSQGCHHLIKQGARLVQDIDDIHEEFQNLSFWQDISEEKNLQKSSVVSLATDKLLDSVDYEVTALDVVAERSGLPVSVVLTTLLEYELRGLVAAVPGGYVKLGAK